ncbi:MAG: hypothetical protein LUC37_06015 [Prevotella sp.]|nr:hypothetical protein [Prevotella sp.]
MKQIVGVLRPFSKQQTFYVLEDSNALEVVKPTLEEIPDVISALAEKYDVTQIIMSGPKQFSKGIQKRIEEKEVKREFDFTLSSH